MSQQADQPKNQQLTNKSPPLPLSPSPWPPARLSNTICLLLIVIFAIFFSTLAVQQHHTFQTNGLDVGNVDQALWNTTQGRFLHFTLMTPIQSRLALHVEPILLLLVPLYWLDLGSPEMLLIIQATIVALGAWPLYRIAQHTLLPLTNTKYTPDTPEGTGGTGASRVTPHVSRVTPHVSRVTPHVSRVTPHVSRLTSLLSFPLAYLLLPTLQSAVLFEFHAVTLAPAFLLFVFWTLEQKKDTHFIIFSLLAMACKEDMPLVVGMLGLYVGLAHRRWRLAGLTIGLSVAWFVIAVFFIQPRFAAGGNIQFEYYAWLGDNPLEMAQTIITQPRPILSHLWYQAGLPGYLAALFFPTAFLALLSPLTLLPMLPTLAINLLSGNPFTWRLEDFHYGAPLAPFLFISAIYGIRRIGEWANTLSSTGGQTDQATVTGETPLPLRSPAPLLLTLLTFLLFTFTAIYHYHRGFTPLARPFIWPQVTAHHRQLEAVLSTIPSDIVLFTQSNLAPHLTHRPTLYTDFGFFTNPDFPTPIPVDDILLDVTSFENIGGLHQFLRQTLLESGDYQTVTARDGILHLRPQTTDNGQRTTDNGLPIPFYTFAQPDPPKNYQLHLDFGDAVRLHGYSLYFNRQEEIQVSLDLEPLQPLTDVQPVLFLLDATGHVIGATTDLQPTLVWFPPDQWPVGEVVRVRFNTLSWYTRQTKAYGLALGLVSGDEVWDISRRHRPIITQPTQFATRFPANGTLIELTRIEQVWGMPEGGPVARQFTPPRIPHPLEANFDNQLELLGHTAPEISETEEGQNLTISLYWQAVTSPENLTRFVQLVGPDSLVYGQNDSAPDYGHYPTHLWQPGEVVQETITFPVQAERPAGSYTLHIGLYRPETGQRLLLVPGGDHVEIAVGW